MAKKVKKIVDGLSPKDIEKIRRAIRQVWSWSYPRRLCLKRALQADGFSVCELCKKTVPKVYADHLENVGDVDAGFIERLFCPSNQLQAICKKCHDVKTRAERQAAKDFF